MLRHRRRNARTAEICFSDTVIYDFRFGVFLIVVHMEYTFRLYINNEYYGILRNWLNELSEALLHRIHTGLPASIVI